MFSQGSFFDAKPPEIDFVMTLRLPSSLHLTKSRVHSQGSWKHTKTPGFRRVCGRGGRPLKGSMMFSTPFSPLDEVGRICGLPPLPPTSRAARGDQIWLPSAGHPFSPILIRVQDAPQCEMSQMGRRTGTPRTLSALFALGSRTPPNVKRPE